MTDNQQPDNSLIGGASLGGQSSLLYELPGSSTNALMGGLTSQSLLFPAPMSISAPFPEGSRTQIGASVPSGPSSMLLGPASVPPGPASVPPGPATMPLGPASVPSGPSSMPLGPSSMPLGPVSVPLGSGLLGPAVGSLGPTSGPLEGYATPDSPVLDEEAEADNFIGQTSDQFTALTNSTGQSMYGGFTAPSSAQIPLNVTSSPYAQRGIPSVPQLPYTVTSNMAASYGSTGTSSEGIPSFQQPTFITRPSAVAQVNPYRIAGKVSHTPVAFDMNSSSINTGPDRGFMRPTTIGSAVGIMETTNGSQPVTVVQQPTGDPQPYTYEPVRYHWMYRVVRDSSTHWVPFSRHDSALIDLSAIEERNGECLVEVEGGRYTVDVGRRLKTAIYWEEPVTEVRRCSWFFRSHGESYFQPYEEHATQILEEQYAGTLMSGDFHKKIEFPAGGGAIVIHSPTVILQFANSEGTSEELDAWGNTISDHRPRALRRGLDDMERDIPDDEATTPPDHLILVVQGLGATARWEGKFRGVTDLVSDMRLVARQMIRDHFKDSVASGTVSRVEFLPICYRNGISSSVMESENAVALVTPSGISKLRGFGNESLSDALFYSSPSHAQSITNAVANEINKIYSLFIERNPAFRGNVSLVGHSSGSVILFDLLRHQSDKAESHSSGVPKTEHFGNQLNQGKQGAGRCFGVESLTELLAQLGLSTYEELFVREQIDLDSLQLLKPDDIKELGIPMGPRKKLLDFLQRVSRSDQDHGQQSKPMNSGPANGASEAPVSSGIDVPSVTYPRLLFSPAAFFSLGSPLALYVSLRRMEINADFMLPTCGRFYNIFHPYDPSAYRIEPLLLTGDLVPDKPLLIPHHKGRKRMHLELRESLVRVGADLKQKLLESWRKTWRAVTGFAASHITGYESQDMEEPELGDVDSVLSDLVGDGVSAAGSGEEVFSVGARLNAGCRVDYVLQEKPIEMFNDYLFAVGSRSCYWLSEDTVLMVLRELYGVGSTPAGTPVFSGPSKVPTDNIKHGSVTGPPPLSGFITQSYNAQSQTTQGGGGYAVIPSQATVNHTMIQGSLAQPVVPVQTGLANKQSTGSSRFGPPLAQFGGSSQGVVKPVALSHSQGVGVGGSRSGTPVLGLAAPAPLPSHLIRK